MKVDAGQRHLPSLGCYLAAKVMVLKQILSKKKIKKQQQMRDPTSETATTQEISAALRPDTGQAL